MDNNSKDTQTPITSLPPVEPQPQIPSETTPPAPEAPVRPPIEITPEPEPIKPPIEITPEPEINLPPAPEITPEPEVVPEPTPEPVDNSALPKTEPNLADFGITQKPASKNNLFKIIFIFSLIVFILVGTVLAFVYFKTQNNSKSDTSTKTSVSAPTVVKTGSCILNDKTYEVGSSFVAADGCNTCTCTSQNNITCTDNECLSTKTSTKSATTTTPTVTPIPTTVKVSTSSSAKK